MEGLTFLFCSFITILLLCAFIVVWSPREFWIKVCALVLTVFLCGLAYAGLADLLGRPKPVKLEWVNKAAKEATVLGSKTIEGRGIYLWLQFPSEGGKEQEPPWSYSLSWSEATKGGDKKEGDDKEGKREGEKSGVGEAGENESSGEDRSKSFAEELQDALRELEMAPEGSELIMRSPLEQSIEAPARSQRFFLRLPPAPPPKGPLTGRPERFEHPGTQDTSGTIEKL